MTKQDLVNAVAAKTGIPKNQTQGVIDATIREISDSLKRGDQVTLRGFATFKAKLRAERVGRNMKTGQPITVPAKIVPVIKAAKELKDSLNS